MMERLAGRALAILGIVVALGCVAVMVMSSVKLQSLRREETQIRAKLEQQNLIQPLQAELKRLSQDRPPEWLEAPKSEPLDSKQLPRLPELFRKPADEAGLEFGELVADVKTLSVDGRQQMAFTVTVTGESSGFHRYLISICQMPFIAELRQVKLHRPEPGRMQLTVSAILSLKG
jgi:Tfp pilus assembly protein PilO